MSCQVIYDVHETEEFQDNGLALLRYCRHRVPKVQGAGALSSFELARVLSSWIWRKKPNALSARSQAILAQSTLGQIRRSFEGAT